MRHKRFLHTLVIVTLALGAVIINFVDLGQPSTEENPLAALFNGGVPRVEASCTVVLNPVPRQENEDVPEEELTLIITLPDGTPLPGVCLTFTRDMGVGEPPELIGTCTTDEEGRCTIISPGGVINVLFGNTKIGGIPVQNDSALVDILDDATTGGVSYYFPGEEPAEENVVAVPNPDGSGITMEHGQPSPDGSGGMDPVPPGPDEPDAPDIPEWPDWDDFDILIFPFPFGDLPWVIVQEEDKGFELELPEGIVTVRFIPAILRTSAAYDRAYCYYANGNSGYARVPTDENSFLPGGGTFFDLGAVMSGAARPGQTLDSETQLFGIQMECWGWQGASLVKIGFAQDNQPREQWLRQDLLMVGSGFSLDYRLGWYGPDVEPASPRLELPNPVGDGFVPPDYGEAEPGAEPLPDTFIGVEQNRFTDELLSPTNVHLNGNQVQWTYQGQSEIGGFRIYRNDYLIGTVPENVRTWSGDGTELLECGQTAEFRVTSFSGGQESTPSEAATLPAPDCEVTLGINLAELTISDLEDCDGADLCSTTAEIYGYVMINDVTVTLGGPNNTLGLTNQVYDMSGMLAPLGITHLVTLGLKADDAVMIEVALFDRDSNTADDLLCTWQEYMPARDAEGWMSMNATRIEHDGTAGEANCNFALEFTVE